MVRADAGINGVADMRGSACTITKLISDKRADLEQVHPSTKEITRDNAMKTDPVPLHPGASQALGG
ncbi:TAXI family TRAP transporter solute-binding subunit [Saccharopolyspora shandongensis]|uniref:TAXI family TRAP transporter solute-binding subunit n=1 Tax=Saccharopolyspora shandongensis TaxID=418495 RepID=UPI00341443FC